VLCSRPPGGNDRPVVLALAALVCVIVAACATSLAMRARNEASSADSPVPLRDAKTVVLPAAAITHRPSVLATAAAAKVGSKTPWKPYSPLFEKSA
jgi:hypothetical protein